MSSDPDIQFGDLEEEQPDVELRPDRNAHYAVVPYEEPAAGELPIFVDLDVLIEMESHALTDTSVELGGVMLGGQLHDEDGQPYVLVKDSVRAQHYEATKGSFKFTHDTWGQITKERDEFPSDWDMVGWYHTHPDWGVFLSGMDMFICDNFFNKTLDVALVIDPCRQDRAFFQWTGDPRERKRRVSGFYVIASRHRQAELEQFVAELEGGYTVRTDPNLRQGYNVSSGGGGAPTIVNITEQRPGWLGQAVVWCIVFQTLMLMMFGWLALSPRDGQQTASDADRQTLLEIERRELAIRRDVLDEVIEKQSGEEDVVTNLEKEKLAADKLRRDLQVATAGVPEIMKERDNLKKKYEEEKEAAEAAEEDAKEWREEYKTLEAKYNVLRDDTIDGDGEADTWYSRLTTGPWLLIGGVVLALAGVAGYFAFRGVTGQDEFPEDFDSPPPEGNFAKFPLEGDAASENEEPPADRPPPPDDGVGYVDEPPPREP